MTAIAFNHEDQTGPAPTGLADLMASPWALTVDGHRALMDWYATYVAGPKIDIKAIEARSGPVATPNNGYQPNSRGVACIELQGVIVPKPNLLTRIGFATPVSWAVERLKAAVADATVKAIVLTVDSPGGSVNGSPELASAVFDASKVKPVVAHSDAQLLSAAYWIGAAANAIYISGPTVHAGSIGIVMTKRIDPDAASNSTEFFAGRYKQYTSSVKPPTQEAIAYLQSQVDYLYTVFVNDVAAFRGVTPAHVNERMAEGQTFIGQQAIDAGLVDEIMPLGALVEAVGRNPSAFAQRRRVLGRRVGVPATGATPLRARSVAPVALARRAMTKAEQASAAVAYAKDHGVTIVQALKVLGFAT